MNAFLAAYPSASLRLRLRLTDDGLLKLDPVTPLTGINVAKYGDYTINDVMKVK